MCVRKIFMNWYFAIQWMMKMFGTFCQILSRDDMIFCGKKSAENELRPIKCVNFAT